MNQSLGSSNFMNQQQLKQQQYLQQLQQLQQAQQTYQNLQNGSNTFMSQQDNQESKKVMKGKKIMDEQQQNLIINPKFHETQFYEHNNMTIDEESVYRALNQQYNTQTVYHEKTKSLTSNQFIKQGNDNSGQKIQQQVITQQQLSPNKMKALLQMTKLAKNSSKEYMVDPHTISPSQNNQIPLKTRRKKSQGKINVNLQNLNNNEEIVKAQQNNQNVRSSSQPQQVRSQSQQAANSQERAILQLKKHSIKNADQNPLIIKQDQLRIAQIESSIERVGSNQNLNKQGSLKIVLKKNSSVKQLQNQQTVKISKDQILLKNQQNFNSQGSGNNQQSQSNLRARSLSNSKFTKKKASPQQVQDNYQQQTEEHLHTQRNKEKTAIGNSFNQNSIAASKQRCKSTNKAQGGGGSAFLEEQQLAINTQGLPTQNQSKVLMFKTNNEESNAKVAALKSLIKLSSNTNANNYIQNKIPQRNQSKENIQNQSQNHIQPGIQMKQIVQKLKMQESAQGQFVQKCASANQNLNKAGQQQQNQYMQRITSGRVPNQQPLSYHTQLKNGKDNQTAMQNETKATNKETLSGQIKINIVQNNKDLQGQENKDQSSSLKMTTGQVNIRNIKVNPSQQQKQQIEQDTVTSIGQINVNKSQFAHQQKMHQILLNQQAKNQLSQNQNQGNVKTTLSRNAFNAASTLEGSGGSLNNKRQSAGVDILPKNLILQNNGVGSNESFRDQNNCNSVKDQFSRKNSTMSNGSIKTQIQTNQKEMNQQSNVKSELYTIKNQSKDIMSRLQNTSHVTYNTNYQESAQRKDYTQKLTERQTIFSETTNNINCKSKNKYSDDKLSGGKKLNFYNQMSPASEVLSQFKDSQVISAFKNQEYDDYDLDQSNYCAEDESMVIIQEDQLRLPLRSSKYSQQTQYNKVFDFDEDLVQQKEVMPKRITQEVQQISKEDMILESIESAQSVFMKKHETSVIEQESLVTQIKTQLMKIHFQQAFQGDTSKTKRQRNGQKQDCQTMKDGGHNKIAVGFDSNSRQSMQGSGTFYFEPQFDDISFELDTCNQIRVPKNMNNPINQAKIMSLPDDLQIYQEQIDPATGKVLFTVDQKTVTILNQNIRKAALLKPENQIIKQSVLQFPDPLQGRLKQDYESNLEEKKEEEQINKQLETTVNFATQPQQTDQSLSFQHSLCSSNNHSLNTFLSEDVSLNSNLISQVMNAQNTSQVAAGIMHYAADKLNVREGDPLFLLPRLKDNQNWLQLKPALLKREPEWWLGHELSLFGGNQKRNDNEPILETFIF